MDKAKVQKTREEICTIWRRFVTEREEARKRKNKEDENLNTGLMEFCQSILNTVNELSKEIEWENGGDPE